MSTFASAIAAIASKKAEAAFNIFQLSGDPWPVVDGRGQAPTGVAQYPTLLNGYPIASPPGARTRWPSNGSQPPWMVAGVDYPVGLNYDTTFSGTTVTKANHNFGVGFGVTFYAAGSGTLPTPLVAGTTYYVRSSNLTANTFEVATNWTSTIGSTGAAITFSGGSGVFIALVDVVAGNNDPNGTAFNTQQTAITSHIRFDNTGKIIADDNGALIVNLDLGASGLFIWVQGFGANSKPNNVTVRNCRWLASTAAVPPNQFAIDGGGQIGSGMLIEKCLFDGNFPNVVNNFNAGMRGCLRPSGPNCIVQYCWFKRYPNTSIQLVNSTAGLGGDNCTFQYNLMDNCMFYTGAHGEPIQISDYIGNNLRFIFNTVYAGAADVNGFPGPYGTAGLVQLQAHAGVNHTYTGYECGNNTLISIGSTGHRDGGDFVLVNSISTPTNTITLTDVPHSQDVYGTNQVILMQGPPGGAATVIPDPTYAIFSGVNPSVAYSLFSNLACTISRNTSGSATSGGNTQFIPYSLNNSAVNNIWVVEMGSGSSAVNPSIHDNYCDLNGIGNVGGGSLWYLPSGTVTSVNFTGNINIRTGVGMASNGQGPA